MEKECFHCHATKITGKLKLNSNAGTGKVYFCAFCIERFSMNCEDCKGIDFYKPFLKAVKENNIKKYVCFQCLENYFECYNCGNCFSSFNRKEHNCHNYCIQCFNNLFAICEICNRIIQNNNPCPNCFLVLQYSAKPTPIFYGGEETEENKLFLGLEIEVNSNSKETIGYINKNFKDFLFLKRDSSVPEGLEIVSHPFTYNYLLDNPNIFNKLLDLRKQGVKSYQTETCGMHVHLSRQFFNRLDEYKIYLFFQKEVSLLFKISQRTDNNFQLWANPKLQDKPFNMIKRKTSQGRHNSINVNGGNTLEIRIFRGTLYPPSFLKNIQFCDALRFVKETSIKEINKKSFMEYILKNYSRYAELIKFIDNKINKMPIKTFYKLKDTFSWESDIEQKEEKERQIKERKNKCV